MNKRCSVCNHASREEIDHGLTLGLPFRPLAAQYGLSTSALFRHTKHLARAQAHESRRQDQAQTAALLDKLDLWQARLDRLFLQAENARSLDVALGCLRESLRLLSLREKLRHSLDSQPQ